MVIHYDTNPILTTLTKGFETLLHLPLSDPIRYDTNPISDSPFIMIRTQSMQYEPNRYDTDRSMMIRTQSVTDPIGP